MAKQSSSGLKELLNDPTVVSSVAERKYSMATQSWSDLKELVNDLTLVSSVAEVQYSWSDLPEDSEYILLDLIMEYLTDLSDLIRCRGVCHSWGFAAARKLCGNNHAVPPLLLLCTRKTIILSRDYGKKLEVSASTITTKVFDLPKFFHFGSIPCLSSYRGWLLLLQLRALPNPVYMKMVPPRESKLLMSADDHYKTTKITILSQFSSPPDPDETTPLYLFNPYSRILVRLQQPPPPLCKTGLLRFITSCTASDPNCIIYAYNLHPPSVAFYGLRHRKWSTCFTPNDTPVEAIFYKGHFYAVDRHGVLRRLLFDMDYNSYEEKAVSASIGDSTPHRYLVKSPSSSGGEVLMMVVRRFDLESRKTNFFEIFKLDWTNRKWEEVKSLGDQALFLAHNDSKLVSVSVHNLEYRQNTIYFVDDVDDLVAHANSNRKDFGLYDLGNREIQPLNLSSEHMSLPHCRWFQPAV